LLSKCSATEFAHNLPHSKQFDSYGVASDTEVADGMGLRRRLFTTQVATLAIVSVAAVGGWVLSEWVSQKAGAEARKVEFEADLIGRISFEMLQALPHTARYTVEGGRKELSKELSNDITNLKTFRTTLDENLTTLSRLSRTNALHRELESIRLLSVHAQRNLEQTAAEVKELQKQNRPLSPTFIQRAIQDRTISEIRLHGLVLSNLYNESVRKLDALTVEASSARLLGIRTWMTGLVLGWVVGLSFAWRTADRILKPLLRLDELMLNPDKDIAATLQSPSFSNAPREIISLSGSFYKLVTESLSLTAQLRDLANTDGLTAVGNRRRFDEVFSQEWKRGLRSRQPLSLLLLDVDHFKLYNDSYGHVEGDLCLGKVADAIKSKVLRSTDLVCRVGGEEFAILLPETGLTEAYRLAEVIINALDSACIDHESSPVASWVTASIGVASAIPQQGTSQRQLMEKADQALYHRKRNLGRHGVTAADSWPSSL
jgi:diguanylate cyclase (GGDEF)-like protein